MNFRSLRFRVTAWSISFLALALGIFSAAVYVGVRQFLLHSQERDLRNLSRNIETVFLSEYGRKGEAWAVGEIRESYGGAADRYVRVLHDGREIFRSEDLRTPALAIATVPLPEPDATGLMHLPEAGGILQNVDRYTAPDGQAFTVISGASEMAARQVLRTIAWILLCVCPSLLVLAAIAQFLLTKQPLRPVFSLIEKAEHVGRDSLGRRLPVPESGDEIQRLAVTLNRMIERLEDALAHNNRFAADASHELRTPLTIVRGELEQAIQDEGVPERTLESIGSALEEIERMSQIVQSLMATAYLDSGGEVMECEAVDLGRLAATTVEQMSLLAEAKGVVLAGNTLEPLQVNGNVTRLKQVMVNLIDNAMKYNAPGGTVSVSVYGEGEDVLLRVADNGVGIPASSLPFIFDRFYRADKTRSRQTGGIGIGLSIAKAICNAHNAVIEVKSREGQGSVFTVRFPRIPAESPTPTRSFTQQTGRPHEIYVEALTSER